MSEITDILHRLDRIEARLASLEGGGTPQGISIDGVPVPGTGDGAPSQAVLDLLKTPGKEIHAIKLHREQTGVSLAEAKAALAPYHF